MSSGARAPLSKKAAPPPLTSLGTLPIRIPSRRPSCLPSPEHWLPLSLRRTRCRLAAAMRLLLLPPFARCTAATIEPPSLCRRHRPASHVAVPCACSAAGRPSGVPPSGAVGPCYLCRPLPPVAPSPAPRRQRSAAAAGPPRQLHCGLPIPSAPAEGHPNLKPQHGGQVPKRTGVGASQCWYGTMLLPAKKATGEVGLSARLRLAACSRCTATGVPAQRAVLRPLAADPAQARLVSHAQSTQACRCCRCRRRRRRPSPYGG